MMESDENCGNVFLTTQGTTVFYCKLCNRKYDGIQNFGLHIIQKHYTPAEDFEVDDLMPNIPDMLKENLSNTETLSAFSSETDEENSESESNYGTEKEFIDNKYNQNNDKLCGEVDLTQAGILIFRCTLCNKKYEGVREYDQHVLFEHFSKGDNLEETKNELPLTKNNNEKNNDDETTHSNFMHKKLNIAENLVLESKKPTPYWSQIFDAFKCPITNTEKYKCKLCAVIIKDKGNVHHHIRRVHEKTKDQKCSVCSRRFHSRSELRIHRRKHTGERPYLCMHCGMSFYSASHLTNHVNNSHKGRRERDKVCPICKKSFYTKKNLQVHASVHSEDRPYKCEICNTRFKRRGSRNLHMRIHDNKRQFKCMLCSASYNYKNILDSHMKSKHALAFETC